MSKKISIGILVFFFFGIVGAPHAEAITLIPPSLEFTIAPGETIETKIKLFNEEQVAKQLYTEAANFTAAGETGNPQYDFSVPVEGLSAWIQMEPGPIVMQPGDRVEVPVKIAVPADADPGGHYAILAFSSNAPDQETTGLAISASLGALFLVNVEGDVIERGTIQELALDHPSDTLTRLPANFIVRYNNSGNVHLRPTGTIVISNMFNKVTDTIEVNPGKGATLPDSIRRYDAIWERAMVTESSGNVWNTFWQEYGNERKNFALGKYTAQLNLTAGSDEQLNDTAAITFWVLPWHVGVVYGLGAIVLIFLLIIAIKRYNAWIIRRAGTGAGSKTSTKGPSA